MNAGQATASMLQPRADLTAWLAVAAGSLGALIAMLDISIVNAALPTIQGEIGATGSEGTWIATSFLIAEIIIIPLTAWLERLLGLRTLLLGAVLLFTTFSVVCGLATNLTMMIVGRTGQGLAGGALIPTAMTIVAKRLPPRQQPIGMALFGLTAIMGPVLGPLLGGWITENWSWHYAFFINIPVGAALVLLLILGLPHQKPDWEYLRNADWLGIIGMILGLGGLTVVLEEGHREDWFDSTMIVRLSVMAAIGFALLLAGQFLAKKPVLKLRLLLSRQFASVTIMGLALGMVLIGSTYVIPQFLAAIAGYNALQMGKVVMLMGIPAMLLMPVVPFLVKIVDIRLAVAAGLLLMAVSCWINADLTAESAGGDFTLGQVVRGVGVVILFFFLNQATVASVPKEEAGDASSIFNAARNLGGALALAAIATIQDERIWLHNRRLEEQLNGNSPMLQEQLGMSAQMFGGAEQALRFLAGTIQREAFVMSYNDTFWIMAMATLLTVPLVLFLRPLPKNISLTMH